MEQRWIVWDRVQTQGPRGGELKHPKQLPFVVEMRGGMHECSAVADDPHLPLRREIGALHLAITGPGRYVSLSEKERIEGLIDERSALLREMDGR